MLKVKINLYKPTYIPTELNNKSPLLLSIVLFEHATRTSFICLADYTMTVTAKL